MHRVFIMAVKLLQLLFRSPYAPWLVAVIRIRKHNFNNFEGNQAKRAVCQYKTKDDR